MYRCCDYKFYSSGAYNVNLYGLRNGYETVDEFNDVLGIAFIDAAGNKNVIECAGTTKPGLYYLKKRLGNINGTAILPPGYYPKCWQIGLHNGYEALIQTGSPFKVWRDNDSDGKFDTGGKLYSDVTGLNCHHASILEVLKNVGAYSAGCQVRGNHLDHFIMMAIAKMSASLYGNAFSYALFDF